MTIFQIFGSVGSPLDTAGTRHHPVYPYNRLLRLWRLGCVPNFKFCIGLQKGTCGLIMGWVFLSRACLGSPLSANSSVLSFSI